MIDFQIISTGSQGNATVIEGKILIDCGVTFKALQPYYKQLKLVLLTHIHTDHFNRTTIRKLSSERPTLRFACGKWLAEPLVAAGVKKTNIDILEFDTMYGYGICNVSPFFLKHNVPNCGYKLHFADAGKMVYATDCNNLHGVSAPGYDLYLIEANYIDEELEEKIRQKRADGLYAYEERVKNNHLSKAKADSWLYENMGPNSIYVYMHCHSDDDETQNQGAAI